jgi:hypothetical protein
VHNFVIRLRFLGSRFIYSVTDRAGSKVIYSINGHSLAIV